MLGINHYSCSKTVKIFGEWFGCPSKMLWSLGLEEFRVNSFAQFK